MLSVFSVLSLSSSSSDLHALNTGIFPLKLSNPLTAYFVLNSVLHESQEPATLVSTFLAAEPKSTSLFSLYSPVPGQATASPALLSDLSLTRSLEAKAADEAWTQASTAAVNKKNRPCIQTLKQSATTTLLYQGLSIDTSPYSATHVMTGASGTSQVKVKSLINVAVNPNDKDAFIVDTLSGGSSGTREYIVLMGDASNVDQSWVEVIGSNIPGYATVLHPNESPLEQACKEQATRATIAQATMRATIEALVPDVMNPDSRLVYEFDGDVVLLVRPLGQGVRVIGTRRAGRVDNVVKEVRKMGDKVKKACAVDAEQEAVKFLQDTLVFKGML